MNQRLHRFLRIHRPAEIREILTTGRKYIGNHIILYCLTASSPDAITRAGFLSPKRMGKAVRRNRFRRWVREAFRQHRAGMEGSRHILIMGRTSAINAGYQAVCDDFLRLCRKARLLPSA